jgi:DNA-binding transcriptional LysR family regulator
MRGNEMELRQLEHFVAVAEEGHFNRAAARCHIVRSGLSASIHALERELGIPLFVRTTREVRLTDAGQALLGEARRTLEAAAAARAAVGDVGRVVQGTLSVGIALPNRSVDLPAVLAVFHDAYPAVTVSVTQAPSVALLEQVGLGVLDMALTYPPTRLPDRLEVHVLDLGTMVFACSPDHPFANRSSVSLRDLRAENFVNVPSSWTTRSTVDEIYEKARLSRIAWVDVNDVGTLLDFVASGFGVAVVHGPDVLGRTSSRGDRAESNARVSYVPIRPGGPAWTFGIVTSCSRPNNAAARAFVEIVDRMRPETALSTLKSDPQ